MGDATDAHTLCALAALFFDCARASPALCLCWQGSSQGNLSACCKLAVHAVCSVQSPALAASALMSCDCCAYFAVRAGNPPGQDNGGSMPHAVAGCAAGCKPATRSLSGAVPSNAAGSGHGGKGNGLLDVAASGLRHRRHGWTEAAQKRCTAVLSLQSWQNDWRPTGRAPNLGYHSYVSLCSLHNQITFVL